ncbi:MAG: hypothetical protein RL339_1705 [Pseudomonadota bacterium]|jgi:hypothetical protein
MSLPGTDPGIDPHDLARRPTSITFAPSYVTIIRIDSPGAWRIGANHASFAIDDPANNTAEARLAQALRVLKKVVPGRRKLSELQPGKPDAEAKLYRRKDGSYDRDDFIDLGCNSQHEIFVYYDSADVTLDNRQLISFGAKLSNGNPAAANDTFFVARVDDSALDGPLKGKLIRIENFNTMTDGSTFTRRPADDPAKTARYALNYHVTLPGRQPLPIVIDPDTGNGNGAEP